MAELNISHYRFRLRRRGWARGDAGQRVVMAARQKLPALVAERLAVIWPEDEVDVSEPVRLRLRVRLAELAAACESDEALAALVARLLPGETEVSNDVTEGARRLSDTPSRLAVSPSSVDDAAVPDAGEVLRVLFEWRARGDLAARLESFTEEALEGWHRAVLEAGGTPPPGQPVSLENLETIVGAYPSPTASTRVARLRRRILIAVEALARFELAPDAAELARALDALLPLPVEKSSPSDERPSMSSARSSSRSTRDAIGPGLDRAISSALPFLLLRSLQRLGCFPVLSTAFAAARRNDELPVFATALAYKVLAAPEPGCRRNPASRAAAAAFAGTSEPASEAALGALAQDAAALLSPLDELVARAMLAGHDPERPLLLVVTNGQRLLVEVDGLFPIAWSSGLHAALASCTAPLVVARGAADTALLAELHARGQRFVTDAPPTRGERWRRLRHHQPLWTNDAHTADHALASAAAVLELEDHVLRLAGALGERRAVTLDSLGAFDRSLSLVAGVALGDLAWTLWREREPTSPELALRRFADLSARVRGLAGIVEVRLPLGPRQIDLERHRFLGEFRVPWLPGRVLKIGGGG